MKSSKSNADEGDEKNHDVANVCYSQDGWYNMKEKSLFLVKLQIVLTKCYHLKNEIERTYFFHTLPSRIGQFP